MNISEGKEKLADVHRRITSSGLIIEGEGDVFPLFNVADQTLTWSEFPTVEPSELGMWGYLNNEPPSEIWPEQDVYVVPNVLLFDVDGTSPTAHRLGINRIDSLDSFVTYSPLCSALDPFTEEIPAYVLTFESCDQIKQAAKVLRPRIAHVVGHCIIFGGKAWLVPAYAQNSTEASAKEHTTHFENVTLNREHSSLNGHSAIKSLYPWSLYAWVGCFLNSCSRWLQSALLRSCTMFTSAVTGPNLSFS